MEGRLNARIGALRRQLEEARRLESKLSALRREDDALVAASQAPALRTAMYDSVRAAGRNRKLAAVPSPTRKKRPNKRAAPLSARKAPHRGSPLPALPAPGHRTRRGKRAPKRARRPEAVLLPPQPQPQPQLPPPPLLLPPPPPPVNAAAFLLRSQREFDARRGSGASTS